MKEADVLRKETKKYLDNADIRTVRMVHALLEAEQEADWWDDLSEGAKASIDRGLKDAARGKVISHEVVMKKYNKWLSK
jgi:predicted transcriptional regulator